LTILSAFLLSVLPDTVCREDLIFTRDLVSTGGSTAYRAAAGTNSQFLLMHSVGNYPQNDEIDVAINYADYYYLEALGRCADLP